MKIFKRSRFFKRSKDKEYEKPLCEVSLLENFHNEKEDRNGSREIAREKKNKQPEIIGVERPI